MPDLYLSGWEIHQILLAIDVSATFYQTCAKSPAFDSVADAFNDMLISQQYLQRKLQNILNQSENEV